MGIENLNICSIHLRGVQEQRIDVENMIEHLKAQQESVAAALTAVDETIHTPLTLNEMNVIIELYAESKKLPQYIVEAIRPLVEEDSIWGLSQAFSYFRTHGEYKRVKNRELSSNTKALDDISGELIMMSPILAELKEKTGEITREVLVPPQPT